jgi:hypothetical protein
MSPGGKGKKHAGGDFLTLPRGAILLNVVLYQTGWFACVLGGAKGRPWLGAGVGLVFLTIHLFLCQEPAREVETVFWIGLAGTAIDSIQAFSGTFVFLSGYWTQWVVPFWLTVMWMQFATLFHLPPRYLLQSGDSRGGLGLRTSSRCFHRQPLPAG